MAGWGAVTVLFVPVPVLSRTVLFVPVPVLSGLVSVLFEPVPVVSGSVPVLPLSMSVHGSALGCGFGGTYPETTKAYKTRHKGKLTHNISALFPSTRPYRNRVYLRQNWSSISSRRFWFELKIESALNQPIRKEMLASHEKVAPGSQQKK